jgi:RNA polymerase sigma-70 factor (ECF subfamily)
MPPAAPIDDLLEHAAWLRRLADHLVRGVDEPASDVLQDAWVAALRAPPDVNRPLRPWLSEVLRNALRKRLRTRRRARAREMEAPDGAAPSPETLVERAEAQRILGELVLALDEPYRRAVLLRYFEGIEPSEIARLQGIPAGTVRWRLSEGLRRLRAALAARYGRLERGSSWGLAPLLPPPAGSAALPARSLLDGVLMMKAPAKALVVVASALALLLAIGRIARHHEDGTLLEPRARHPTSASADPEAPRDGGASAALPRTSARRAGPPPPRFLPADRQTRARTTPGSGDDRDADVDAGPARGLAAPEDRSPGPEELARRAGLCELRFDVPGAKSDERLQSQGWATDDDLAATGLAAAELELAKQALARYKDALAGSWRAAIVEMQGALDPSLVDADVDNLEARMVALMTRLRPGEIPRARRALAHELAGLRRAPDDAERPLAERNYRRLMTLADEFERDLAEEAGAARAAELRRLLSGRQINSGCPEKK